MEHAGAAGAGASIAALAPTVLYESTLDLVDLASLLVAIDSTF
eukprot:COSAG01_NODE_42227_length_442_cov_0.871720_1_plen_43_part_00